MLTVDAINYYYEHPVEFVEDILKAKPTKEQKEILNSLVHNPMTSVRSGHGVGKTAVEAWAVIWFMCTRPFPKIPCTAPTHHQLSDILWGELSKWIRNNPAISQSLILTKERLFMDGYSDEWFAVARTATKPDAMQGFHSEHILYIIDEASGVSDEVFEPVLGALSTSGARLLMCGNPTQLSGFFYESHNKNRARYKTFHIDGRTSERVSKTYIDDIISMYGEDSNVFRVRVAGEFPTDEDDVFIPLPMCERSAMTEYTEPKTVNYISIGCDVARYGDDKTVIGAKIDELFEIHKKINGQDTMRTADDIIAYCRSLIKKYKYKYQISVKIDDGGVGGAVVDRLRQIKRQSPNDFWWLEIFPVHFGIKLKNKYYDDSTSYMFSVIKTLLNPVDSKGKAKDIELIIPNDDNLIAQLSGRKYIITDKSKIRIESKDDYKKRGRPSPDEADCLCLACLPVIMKKDKKMREADGQKSIEEIISNGGK